MSQQQQQQPAPEHAATSTATGPEPGTLEWARDLAVSAGNSHVMAVLGTATSGWVGGAIGHWLDAQLASLAEQPAPSPSPEAAPPQVTVQVSAPRLNVRSSPDSSSSGNLLGQLAEGDRVAVIAENGDWYSIEFQGQIAWIHGGYTTPVQVQDGAGQDPGVTEVSPPEPEQGGDDDASGGVDEAQARPETGLGSQDYEDRILDVANDFNNVPVWSKGTAQTEGRAGTFRTPYVLNVVPEADEAATIKRLTIAQGRPHAGRTVQQAATNNPFVGKATPAQMQIVAQACIDNDLATPATIQTYVNGGRMRDSGLRNGKFGVDCSGLVSQTMHDLEGQGREGFSSTNAHSYRHDGSRGQTPISPDAATSGDVISYETSNHVVVIHRSDDVDISAVGQEDGQGAQRRAVKLSVTESTASQNTANSQYVRTDRRFWYFPEATQVLGRANNNGPEWVLATGGDTEPRYQAAVANTSFTGSADWSGDYTLNCPSDRNGTNVRVREADGSFTSTRTVIPNGASGVELREVSGSMVRVRYQGQDMQGSKEMWVPVAYVASANGGFSIPERGQVATFRPSTYSVTRNPNLPMEEGGA